MIQQIGTMIRGIFNNLPQNNQFLSKEAKKVVQYAKDHPLEAGGSTLIAIGAVVISLGAAPVVMTAAVTTETVAMMSIGTLAAAGGTAVLVYDNIEKSK